jgi:hypothetical protein
LVICDRDSWYARMRLTGGVAKYAADPPSYAFMMGSHLWFTTVGEYRPH